MHLSKYMFYLIKQIFAYLSKYMLILVTHIHLKLLYCESSPRKIQIQHQPLAAQETASPVALPHGKPGVAYILFSQSATFNGEGAILCENTGGGSEHSTDPVAPPVTSSNPRFSRFAPLNRAP